MKKVFAICGSTRERSANLSLLHFVKELAQAEMEVEIFNELSSLPHFNPDLDKETAPQVVEELRDRINKADGVLICTPEYVFSLPGALKNLLEWFVSTIIFTDKPVAFITASASGAKAHEQLQLVLRTIGANLRSETQLLIQGAKGKISNEGTITDAATVQQIEDLLKAFVHQLNEKKN